MIEKSSITVNVMAFGFKYGLPSETDFVFDVRCLKNPFYIEELKHETGNDKAVQDYVMSFDDSKIFFKNLLTMMTHLLAIYSQEEKETVTIAIGCTGGKHRSVTIANKFSEAMKEKGYKVNIFFRDIKKDI